MRLVMLGKAKKDSAYTATWHVHTRTSYRLDQRPHSLLEVEASSNFY